MLYFVESKENSLNDDAMPPENKKKHVHDGTPAENKKSHIHDKSTTAENKKRRLHDDAMPKKDKERGIDDDAIPNENEKPICRRALDMAGSYAALPLYNPEPFAAWDETVDFLEMRISDDIATKCVIRSLLDGSSKLYGRIAPHYFVTTSNIIRTKVSWLA